MHRAAWLVGGALVLTLVLAPSAHAGCTTYGEAIGAKLCGDGNGNGLPDQVSVWTPAGGVDHRDATCGDCSSLTKASAGTADVGVGAEMRCVAPDVAVEPDCQRGEAAAGGDLANVKVWYFTTEGEGGDGGGADDDDEGAPTTWICMKVHANWVTVVECRRVYDW